MREDRNQFQIIRKDARNCFVESLNDSFSIGRIHLAFAAYDQSKPAGQRQTNNVHIYIAVDIDCSNAATLNYRRMFGEVHSVIFAVLQHLVRGL